VFRSGRRHGKKARETNAYENGDPRFRADDHSTRSGDPPSSADDHSTWAGDPPLSTGDSATYNEESASVFPV